MDIKYKEYASFRLSGRFGKLSSFCLVWPYLKNKKVLDVGCSNGLYLEGFSEESVGIEQVRELADDAVNRGLSVINKDIMDGLGGIEDESFEAVFYSHVMEHVECPLCTLKEINRILQPKGILVLGLPIENCLPRQVLRHDYYNGTHIYSFTIKNTRKLLLRSGFELGSVIYHFPWVKGGLGELINRIWNKMPIPGREWFSMAYWVVATKKTTVK